VSRQEEPATGGLFLDEELRRSIQRLQRRAPVRHRHFRHVERHRHRGVVTADSDQVGDPPFACARVLFGEQGVIGLLVAMKLQAAASC